MFIQHLLSLPSYSALRYKFTRILDLVKGTGDFPALSIVESPVEKFKFSYVSKNKTNHKDNDNNGSAFTGCLTGEPNFSSPVNSF